jgi:hypothetical protein
MSADSVGLGSHMKRGSALPSLKIITKSANKNPVDQLCAGPTIYQIAFDTAIADVPLTQYKCRCTYQ